MCLERPEDVYVGHPEDIYLGLWAAWVFFILDRRPCDLIGNT